MTTDHEFAVVASTTDVQKVFVAIELSKATWVVAIQPPAVDKVSLFRIAGGEIERLFELFEQARRRAGQPIEICACYEASYDGFWIYRALTARGVACTVLDSASIQVSRRARRVKTDRTDAESLVRVLMAIYRGEHQVAKIVQVPSPEEEDDKRLLRCRGNLLRDRIQHMNRIRGLLNLQGVRHIDPNRSNWENELVNLRTGDGRSFPRQLMNEVRREGKLLGTVVRMLKEVEAEIAGMIRDEPKRRHLAQRGQNHPIARRLAEIHGVGPQTAGILATEVFYRGFKNRREVASYVGLTPTPYNSGTMVRDHPARVAAPRDGSKLAMVIEHLRRADGATIVHLTQVTGWLPHTTRAALTGLRKRGYAVIRERIGAQDSVYRISNALAYLDDRTVRQRDAVDGRGPKQKGTRAA